MKRASVDALFCHNKQTKIELTTSETLYLNRTLRIYLGLALILQSQYKDKNLFVHSIATNLIATARLWARVHLCLLSVLLFLLLMR